MPLHASSNIRLQRAAPVPSSNLERPSRWRTLETSNVKLRTGKVKSLIGSAKAMTAIVRRQIVNGKRLIDSVRKRIGNAGAMIVSDRRQIVNGKRPIDSVRKRIGSAGAMIVSDRRPTGNGKRRIGSDRKKLVNRTESRSAQRRIEVE
jgi:hypothetical protein